MARLTSSLLFKNCVFNDCGIYVDGGAGSSFEIDGCQTKYTESIASLIIVDYGSAVTGKIKNSSFYADAASSGSKLNASAHGTLVEFSNSYFKNASLYTNYAQPFTMIGSTIAFDSTATPTAEEIGRAHV